MPICSKKLVKKTLRNENILPLKRLGQNFLIDKGVIKRTIAAADLKKNNIVLEIGPGTGFLTKELAKKVKTVIAVEKDARMVNLLNENIKSWGYKNIKVFQEDVLKADIKRYMLKTPKHPAKAGATGQAINYKLVANLPYYITSPVIRSFLERNNPPKLMVLMIQKEVAQRICAKPPNMSILAVSVQFYAKPKIISFVSKKSFWPQPKVDSAIIKITKIKEQRIINRKFFFEIVRAGFSQPRKKIINNLYKKLKKDRKRIADWLLKNKVRPEQRAETLSINDWLALTVNFPFA